MKIKATAILEGDDGGRPCLFIPVPPHDTSRRCESRSQVPAWVTGERGVHLALCGRGLRWQSITAAATSQQKTEKVTADSDGKQGSATFPSCSRPGPVCRCHCLKVEIRIMALSSVP